LSQLRGRVLAEKNHDLRQHRYRVARIHRRRQGLLGELFPCGIYCSRQVQVARCVERQGLLQRQLPGGARQAVPAAHDVGDALCGIVDHDGQLVGDHAVASADHDVGVMARIELDLATGAVADAPLLQAIERHAQRAVGSFNRQALIHLRHLGGNLA
jgi:hypothetical protein